MMEVHGDFIFDPYLVLYLPLHELDGAAFRSKDAYGHLCTVTGALWRPDHRYFDGSDDCVTIPDAASLDITSTITTEVWIYPLADQVGNSKTIAGKYATYALIHDSASADLKGAFIIHDGAAWHNSDGPVTISKNTWHHVVGTYDQTTIKFYLDTVLKTSRVDASITIATTTADLTVGALAAASQNINCRIGEFRLYSRALTPLEIQHNYLATKWRYR